MSSKECTKCHLVKDEELFPWNDRQRRATRCKDCRNERAAEYRKAHPELRGTDTDRPGKNEYVGDSILSIYSRAITNSQPPPVDQRSAPSGMTFYSKKFDPELARIRAMAF